MWHKTATIFFSKYFVVLKTISQTSFNFQKLHRPALFLRLVCWIWLDLPYQGQILTDVRNGPTNPTNKGRLLVFIPFEKVVAISFSWLTWVRGSQRHVFKQHPATCHIPMQYFFANIMVNVIFYTSPLLSTSMNDFSDPLRFLLLSRLKHSFWVIFYKQF